MRLFNLLRLLWRALPLSPRWRQRIKQALLAGPWAPLRQAPVFDLTAWNGDWQGFLPPLDEPVDRILIIDWQPPTPDLDSGSVRLWSILELMLELGLQIDFIADRNPPEPRYLESLQSLGIQTCIGRIAACNWLAASGYRYSHVWISRPEIAEHYLPLARAYAPQARVIYDTVDLHWVRFARGVPYASDPEAMRQQAERYQRLELANAQAADRVIAITEDERATLLAEDPTLEVFVLPNIHPVAEKIPPWEARRDLLFIGGFQHAPNVDAMHYFAAEILPLIRAELPEVRLIIAGSQVPESIRALASPAIEPVGYIPEVRPYFDQARVFVAPLRQGAGMKGKIGQSLGFGLPVVTTAIGAEGMGLIPECHALIADDPESFSQGVIRLYRDRELWQRLSDEGRRLVQARYTKAAVGDRLRAVLASSEPSQTDPSGTAERCRSRSPVTQVQARDSALADAGMMRRNQGAGIPTPSCHRDGETSEGKALGNEGDGIPTLPGHPSEGLGAASAADRRVLILGIYLAEAPNHALAISCELMSARDWQVDLRWAAIGGQEMPASPTPVQLGETGAATRLSLGLEGEWAPGPWMRSADPVACGRGCAGTKTGALGRTISGQPPSQELAALTWIYSPEPKPKFVLLNRLLAGVRLADYRYLVVVDDDIELPAGFLDCFLAIQERRGFTLAQPARTGDSFIDHHFVMQLVGVESRQTRFVEIGPLFALRREGFSAILPFDESAPMGWGLDFVWPLRLERLGLSLGIIDAVPVRHALRPPVSTYDYAKTQAAMQGFLGRQPHLGPLEAWVAFVTYPSANAGAIPSPCKRPALQGNEPQQGSARGLRVKPTPWLSAILCTRNRAQLLNCALVALCAQTLDPERFEVILVDDGSTDETAQVAERFTALLNLRYVWQPHAGLAAAKNHGISLARAPILVFVDDDDVLDSRALAEHLAAHRREPDPAVAVLGWTGLAGKAARSPLMRYVSEVGCQLFYYPALRDGQELDFSFFWGGRSSCKREILLREGLFDPQFRFGAEDIELAFRLRRVGLRVRYHARARSYMIRDLSVDDFARRSELQGRANWAFYRKHPHPLVWDWAQLEGVEQEWARIAEHYPRLLKSARDLHHWAMARIEQGLPLSAIESPSGQIDSSSLQKGEGLELRLLHRAYAALFRASRIKGTVERMGEG